MGTAYVIINLYAAGEEFDEEGEDEDEVGVRVSGDEVVRGVRTSELGG